MRHYKAYRQMMYWCPDWIIEIVSLGSRRMDYYTKLFEYHTAGIVAPGKNRITVYNLEHGDIDEYSFSDTVKAVIYQDLFIDFNNISY